VVFGSAPFADWLAWITSLQTQQIRLDSSRIEALSTPGLVGVTATFVRAKSQ
jgi:type II secretory pathway component PulM